MYMIIEIVRWKYNTKLVVKRKDFKFNQENYMIKI